MDVQKPGAVPYKKCDENKRSSKDSILNQTCSTVSNAELFVMYKATTCKHYQVQYNNVRAFFDAHLTSFFV